MKDKYIIAFAGAVGSSKTPIAYYLSWNLGLPIISNDAIRTEIVEDYGLLDKEKYITLRDKRLSEIVETGHSFIYDASIDREWEKFKDQSQKLGFKTFVISMDLSEELLTKLYRDKAYTKSLKRIDQLLSEHENFLKEFNSEIDLHIKDEDFSSRLEISLKAVKKWLE